MAGLISDPYRESSAFGTPIEFIPESVPKCLKNIVSTIEDVKDFSNLLLDKCVITAKDFAQAQIQAGCDIIGMGDAICSQIDVQTYISYVKERQKEIIDYIHEKGGLVKLHICGDITHLLPEIKDLNVDILDLDWQVDLDEAFQIIGPDVIRCGNINPVDIQNLSAEEVKNVSNELCNKESGRKYILSGGCEITVNTPSENLKAMREASL